jgi:hypothetical protein
MSARLNLAKAVAVMALFSTPLARAEMSCEGGVTLDDRYEDSGKSSVEITNLLNKAFSPFLKSLHQSITHLPLEDVHEAARLFESARRRERVPALTRDHRAKGFNAAFKGNIYFYPYGLHDFDAPFTDFSAGAMAKFDRALYVTEYLMRKKFHPRHDRTLLESGQLRSERTFAGEELEKQFYYGFLSAAQSVGALIADPVGPFNAEELLRKVMSPNGRKLSLVVMHSLMLPPRVLGPNGNFVYFKNALEFRDGRLTFSPAYAGFIKRFREEFFADERPDPCEQGHGCPVGHKLGDEPPSLQVFLDTVMYVYDRLP